MMILVFAMSITPKQLLHNLFSNHNDISYSHSRNNNSQPQINKAGINCQCVDFVAESPFIDINDVVNIIPVFFHDKKAWYCSAPYSLYKFFSEFRGPPSLAFS
jgi:hypothetical protein